jgi:PAS domain S-box-containing protein
MIDREHTKMLNQVKSHIKVANHLFYQEKIEFNDEESEIEIENQITHEKQNIEIKSLQRNGKNILNSSDFIDLTDSLFGGTTTIFQKIENGYLRISTNVPDDNNKKAIGTYIPNTSEVIKTIENGEKYFGRAYVVNDWYITAYEPIYVNDSLCGMLYVGVVENEMDVLAETLAKLKIGKTGFAFVFDKKGDLIISPEKSNPANYVKAIIEQTSDDKGIITFIKKDLEVIAYQYNPATHLYVAANMKLKKEVEVFVKSFIFYLIITNIIAILAFFTVVLLTTPSRLLRLIEDVKLSKLKLENTRSELEKTEKYFETIFNQSSDGIFVCSTNGEILEVNNLVCDILNYSKEELLTKNILDITLDIYQEEQKKNFEYVLTNDSVVYESAHLSKNNEIISIEIKSNLIEYKNEKAIICIARNIEERKALEQKLLSAVIQTEDRERERFSKDMHDGLGPLLSTIKMYVNEIEDDENSADEKADLIKYLNELIDEAISSTRTISNNLLPRIIYEFGLEKAISSFVSKVNRTNKIKIDFNSFGVDRDLNKNTQLLLYRIVSELINNTIKHAKANKIEIKLEYKINNLVLEFKDDGVGFDFSEMMKNKKTGIGLKSIQSRVNSLNGKFEINTKSGEGLYIKIVI